MISKSFIKSSFIYSVVGSLSLATSILLLPFYGNPSLLSTHQFGLLAIYIAFSELVRILFNYSVDNYLCLNFIHYDDSKIRRQKIIGTSVLFMIVFGGAFSLLSFLSGKFIFSAIFPNSDMLFYPYGLLSVLTGLFRGIFKTYTNLLIYRQKPRPFFYSNIFTFILTVAASIIGLYALPLSLDGPIWGRFIGAAAGVIWAMIYFVAQSNFKYDKDVLKDLLHYSTPVFIYSILFWSISNIDRYLILTALNESQVAVFDFAVKMTLLVDFLQNGMSGAINPKVFRIWKNNGDIPESNTEINRYYNTFTILNQLSIPLFFIALIVGVPFIISNEDLYLSFALLPILFAGMTTRIWHYYLITPIYYFKKTILLPFIFGIVAVFQIVSTYFLIAYFDLEGAAWANFFTKIFQIFILFLFVKPFFKISVNPLKMIVYPIIYMLLLLIMQFSPAIFNQLILNIIHFAFLVILTLFFFRKEIPSIKTFFRR